MYSFPDLIKKIRASSGLTQEQLAKALDVSTILISMVESGQKEVSKNLIVRLSDILDVHPSSITPFLFAIDNSKNVSSIEKKIIEIGEQFQDFLINNKAKKLKEYV